MGEERNLEVVRRMVALWGEGRTDEFVDFFHEDVLMETTPDWPRQGPWRGREVVRRETEDWRSPWESIDIEIAVLEAAGNRVAAQARWITRGEASGVVSELPFSILYEFDDAARIRYCRFFTEPGGAAEELRGAD